jgi:hypothetical protein
VDLLTGFENHRGVTTLDPGTASLGRVLRGTGNGVGDGAEGVVASMVIGTYLHGPVLARNPSLADELLRRVTGRSLPPLVLPDEQAARRTHLRAAGLRWPEHRRSEAPPVRGIPGDRIAGDQPPQGLTECPGAEHPAAPRPGPLPRERRAAHRL